MMTSLDLKNFTVFRDAHFDFGQFNVIVGENGTGKTHILKAVYSTLAVGVGRGSDSGTNGPTKTFLQTALADKLRGVFRPDDIGRLVRRQPGRGRSEITCKFNDPKQNLRFSLNSTSKTEVVVEQAPSVWGGKTPIYLPTRELLSIAPGFVSLYETTYLPFEETWRDTSLLLSSPLARGPREAKSKQLLEPLEQEMGGKVDLDEAGRFYLKTGAGNIEMHLVAEGMRKLAMVARLIASGSLLGNGYLFWDEPEANLNPKVIKALAPIILQIAQSGIQVFIATHSLFLLRELYILQESEFKSLDTSYFGLHSGGNGIEVEGGQTMDDIGDISALDEELSQSQRYLETEDAFSTASGQEDR